ncbi:helix-turn-helix domain-containing protein [Bacillus taeanensis]|uniref:Transcriptional regulator n=1 Tax=Bacillus taeanensis TaxID=273032 RepID=A0A366XRC5_9BACI|nr:helix-turn-helix domain-containing protein [Bacillus taeanensis]RBW67675.1 transcriptional regulator [Bacillus taeanensis]
MDKLKVMMHPERIKILQELIGGKKLTPLEISKRLKGISQATLYRHIKKLEENSIITVAEEKQVRGTVEKYYVVNEKNANLTEAELRVMSKEDHMQVFMMFLISHMKDYEQYIQDDDADLLKDGVSFRQAVMYMTGEEFIEFAHDLKEVFMKHLFNEPSKNRKKRTFTTITFPLDQGDEREE